jgi:hypothetical protein
MITFEAPLKLISGLAPATVAENVGLTPLAGLIVKVFVALLPVAAPIVIGYVSLE